MMNNCWYTVKLEIVEDGKSGVPEILFRHPAEPGTSQGGWMKPSTEIQIADAKQDAGTPQKQFTREEIERHDKEDDCWILIDGKVYDVTSVLAWHPGGKAAILGHGGKVHQETTDEFSSIHDGYAYQKLNGEDEPNARSRRPVLIPKRRVYFGSCNGQSQEFHKAGSREGCRRKG